MQTSDLRSGNSVIDKKNVELRLAHYIELTGNPGEVLEKDSTRTLFFRCPHDLVYIVALLR